MVSEKDKTGPDSESAVDLRKDQAFKELIHDGYVLAAIIGGVIPEFKGRTRDEILKCLQTGANGRYVKGRDTESVSSENGPIIRDSVFDVKLPESEGDMEVIVSIEGQGPGMSEAHALFKFPGKLTDKRRETLKQEFSEYPELVSFIDTMDAKDLKDNPLSFLEKVDAVLSNAK